MKLYFLKSPPNITCAVEEVWPFQDVTILEKRFSIISIHERLCLIHLPVLHHLQPLRVMPAELLTLDLLAPLHIIFLQTQTERLLAQDTERLCLYCLAACATPKMRDQVRCVAWQTDNMVAVYFNSRGTESNKTSLRLVEIAMLSNLVL